MAGGPRLSKAKARQAKTSAPVGPMTGRAVSRSEMRPNGSKRRGFAVGDPARQSRDGDGKTSAPVGPMTGQRGFAERNATEWEQAPGFCRWGPGAAEP